MKKIKIGPYFAFFVKKASTKNIRLRMDKNGNLVLSAPWYCSESKATAFALDNLMWIEKQMQNKLLPHTFSNGEIISILGKNYVIQHNPNHKTGCLLTEGTLTVGGEADFLHRRVTAFCKELLYAYIQQKAIEMAKLLHEKPHKITLRDTSSRWGSCSSRKDLNFCWKLVFAPLYVIDYIVAHEVAHLKEMNHSADFWETVALFNVEQASAQIWLRKHGRELQAIV